jgi:hypothetical protein
VSKKTTGSLHSHVFSVVIDPKVPLTLTLSPKGRGDRISPPLRGGDKGEGVIFMLLCERLLMSIPAILKRESMFHSHGCSASGGLRTSGMTNKEKRLRALFAS